MKKLLGIMVLGLLLGGNAYAAKVSVTAEVNSYYSDQSKIMRAYSSISIEDAKQKAIQECKKDQSFNNGKPEGCLIWVIRGKINGSKFYEKIWDNEVSKFKNTTLKKLEEQKQRAEAKASGDLTFTIKDKKEQCTAIGFAPATEKFADCVLRLVELDVKSQQAAQIALAQSQGNQQVAEQLKKQNNSRSSDAFINFGLKLLSPQSTVSAPTTTNCRVIGSGAYKTVNCW
jgi:hypothetical protein